MNSHQETAAEYRDRCRWFQERKCKPDLCQPWHLYNPGKEIAKGIRLLLVGENDPDTRKPQDQIGTLVQVSDEFKKGLLGAEGQYISRVLIPLSKHFGIDVEKIVNLVDWCNVVSCSGRDKAMLHHNCGERLATDPNHALLMRISEPPPPTHVLVLGTDVTRPTWESAYDYPRSQLKAMLGNTPVEFCWHPSYVERSRISLEQYVENVIAALRKLVPRAP